MNTPTIGVGYGRRPTTGERPTLATVQLLDGQGVTVKQWIVKENRISIGSHVDCSIELPGPTVQPVHASLAFGRRHIVMKSFAAGILVNGRPVQEWLFDKTTDLQIASHVLRVIPQREMPSQPTSRDVESTAAARRSSPSTSSVSSDQPWLDGNAVKQWMETLIQPVRQGLDDVRLKLQAKSDAEAATYSAKQVDVQATQNLLEEIDSRIRSILAQQDHHLASTLAEIQSNLREHPSSNRQSPVEDHQEFLAGLHDSIDRRLQQLQSEVEAIRRSTGSESEFQKIDIRLGALEDYAQSVATSVRDIQSLVQKLSIAAPLSAIADSIEDRVPTSPERNAAQDSASKPHDLNGRRQSTPSKPVAWSTPPAPWPLPQQDDSESSESESSAYEHSDSDPESEEELAEYASQDVYSQFKKQFEIDESDESASADVPSSRIDSFRFTMEVRDERDDDYVANDSDAPLASTGSIANDSVPSEFNDGGFLNRGNLDESPEHGETRREDAPQSEFRQVAVIPDEEAIDPRAEFEVPEDALGLDVAEVFPASSPTSESKDEESIESYMEQLLRRVRGDTSAVSASPAPAHAVAESPSPTHQESHDQESESLTFDPLRVTSLIPEQPAPRPPYRSRQVAPEKLPDISAMRELANSTTRSAINQSQRKRSLSKVYAKVLVSLIGFLSTTFLLALNGLKVNFILFGAVSGTLVGVLWGWEAVQELRSLRRAESTPSAKS